MSEEIELPKGWAIESVGDLLTIVSGNTPKGLEEVSNKGDIQFYKVSDMNLHGNELFMRSSNIRITAEEAKKLKIKLFPKGTIIFPKRGGAILTNKKRILAFECSFDLNLMGIIPNNQIISKYVFYFLYRINLSKIYDGSSVPQINNKNIEPLVFPLPPLAEQHRIVAKIEELFSSLDKAIESITTAKAQLKVYRQAVLKWAFEGRFTNDNVKDGELPKGWELKSIADVAGINPALPHKNDIDKNLEVQFLPMKLVEEKINKIHLLETRKYNDVSKGSYTPFIDGDVIFAKVTPCMENGKIAVVNNLKNSIGFGSSEFHVLRCTDKIINNYLFHYLVQDKFRNKAQAEMTGAVGLRRVPKQFLENYLITLPINTDEQIKIVSEIESRLSVCDKIEEGIENSLLQAEALRQSILKKAFEGKLVPQDPSDEPAWKLIERIKAEREPAKKSKAKIKQ